MAIRKLNADERIAELEKLLQQKEAEAAYYRLIAEASGKRRLREVDQLSTLIRRQKETHEEYTRLQQQLEQTRKMETIGMMAAGVAHDLNNVLAGIVGLPDLILMQLPEESPLRDPVIGIRNSGKKAATIVQDLLTLSRQGTIVQEVTNLNDIIRDYLDSPEYATLQQFHPGMKMTTVLDPALMNIIGSPVHLCKVIMNLVTNAAESMPEGGTIAIATRNTLSGGVPGGNAVELSISDTGMGISTHDMERIFDPFFTRKKSGRSGTGLGMTVVWGTVKNHRGHIDIQSETGKGTTVLLHFPVTKLKRAETTSVTPLHTFMGNGESILVVDDVAEQREIASTLLSRLNYSVSSSPGGEHALEYLRNNPADLVILDMVMDPGINGLETYRRIIEVRPGQKAILSSGFSEAEHAREARLLGINGYLQKPFTLEDIGRAVKAGLS